MNQFLIQCPGDILWQLTRVAWIPGHRWQLFFAVTFFWTYKRAPRFQPVLSTLPDLKIAYHIFTITLAQSSQKHHMNLIKVPVFETKYRPPRSSRSYILHIPFPCPFRRPCTHLPATISPSSDPIQSAYMSVHSNLTKSGLLVLDGNITAGSTLVLTADEVRDLLILGLLDGGLVVLGSSTHELLLDEIDSWEALVRNR